MSDEVRPARTGRLPLGAQEIPGCGHVAYIETPEAFFGRVREWAERG